MATLSSTVAHCQQLGDPIKVANNPNPQPFSPRPSSFYAAPASATTSAFVHDQSAAFWAPYALEQVLDNPLRWGPLQAQPFATYRFTYGNGLNAQPGRQENTAVHQISPGLLARSKYLTLNYSPTLSYYSSHAFKDSVDHSASASLHEAYGDWSFALSHNFSKSSQPLIETGTQTPQENNSTTISVHYAVTDKTSLDFSLSQQIQKAEALNSSRTWSSMNWANYQISEKTLIGIGAGVGYTDVKESSDMQYEQLQGRIGWRPGKKLTVDLNGGIEIRHFLSGSAADRSNPLFGASVAYTPWQATTFSLSANRAVSTSLFVDQTTENTQVLAEIRQRIVEVLHLSLFGSYSTVDYQSTSGRSAGESGRKDTISSASLNLSLPILSKGEASLFYQYSKNSSTFEGLSFNSNQYGLQFGYRF